MMEVISGKSNQIVKLASSLTIKKNREQSGLYLVEGDKVVKEALNFNVSFAYLIIRESGLSKYSDLLEKYPNEIKVVSDELYNKLSETKAPQNIIMVAKIVNKTASMIPSNTKNLLVLDHLQDPGNLGTIIRTAVASGFEYIISLDSTDETNSKVVRSSASAIFNVNIIKMSTKEFINFAVENGYAILSSDMDGKNVFDSTFELPKRYAVVVGNEGNGISKELILASDLVISIPMKKNIESLNASVVASILMYVLNNKSK